MMRIVKTNRDIWSKSKKRYCLPFGLVIEVTWERLYKIDGGDVCVDNKVQLKRVKKLSQLEKNKFTNDELD